MVELILISVGLFAIVVFMMNVRAGARARTPSERKRLDGSPHWVDGAITSLTAQRTYLGMTIAKVDLQLGELTDDATGPIPPAYESQITAGLPVRGHVEYDVLDTLQTDLWDSSPLPVLTGCAARLGVEPRLEGDPDVPELQLDDDVTVVLATDGWLTIIVPPGLAKDELYVDLRCDFDDAENTHMLTERLGVTREQAEGAKSFLDALKPETLARLEAIASIEGWVCVDADGIDFEFALPFPESEVIARLVEESLAIAALMKADVEAPRPEDEHW